MIYKNDKNLHSESVTRFSAISALLVGVFFYSYPAEAAYSLCSINPDPEQHGVTVIEYGVGNIGYADYDVDVDKNNSIYAKVKSVTGSTKTYQISTLMNLNDSQGQAMLSSLKTALVTGVSVKLWSTDDCKYISSISVMDH